MVGRGLSLDEAREQYGPLIMSTMDGPDGTYARLLREVTAQLSANVQRYADQMPNTECE